MRRKELFLILISLMVFSLVSCMNNNDMGKIVNPSKSEIDNSNTHEFTIKDALDLVSREYYNGSTDNLFMDEYSGIEPGVFVISEKYDFGSGLYSTMQAYLIKDSKIIETLYDNEMNFNDKFWDKVNNYIVKPEVKKNLLDENLCADNEDIVLSFKMKNSNKRLSLCKAKNDDYLIYRFGTLDNVEFEYPRDRENSWNHFKYSYYLRGGGTDNAGLDLNYLTFENGNYIYVIYDEYPAEQNERFLGVLIYNKERNRGTDNIENRIYDFYPSYKLIDLEGNSETATGSMIDFRLDSKLEVEEL